MTSDMSNSTNPYASDAAAYDPRQAIEQNLDGKLSEMQLLRGFMTYIGWRVPAGAHLPGQPRFAQMRVADGQLVCCAFSDAQAVDSYLAAMGDKSQAATYTDAVGWSVFGSLGEDVDAVDINPFSPQGIHYEKQQLPGLLQWAQAVQLEDALFRRDPHSLSLIKHYAAFRILLQPGGGGAQMVLVQGQQGRKLAAVFTAEDTFDVFLHQMSPRIEDLHLTAKLTGEQLFTALYQMPLDGIIFNCMGPIPAIDYGPQLSEAVLSAN